VIADKKNPRIDSITPLFPGADWIEREMWEMLGIEFTGHPDMKKLLLCDDWPQGNYPLRRTNES
jgi:NADH-quinone oxidoreductase subunit C